MADLTEFLTARLDEDELWARASIPDEPGDHMEEPDPDRLLREVAAKRAILADHAMQLNGSRRSCSRCHYGNSLGASWPCLTVERLAAVYSDHPDYDEAWKADDSTANCEKRN